MASLSYPSEPEGDNNLSLYYQDFYDAFFNQSINGMAICKIVLDQKDQPIDYIFLKVNESFLTQTGLRDVVNKKVTELMPNIKNSSFDFIGVHGKVALTGEPTQFETYQEDLKQWYLVSVVSPKKGYFLSTFTNITERKKTEEVLRASEARFRSLYENSLDAVLLTIPDGAILNANPAAQRMFGMTEDEIRKAGRAGVIVHDERTLEALAERQRTGRFQAELTFKRKDSSTFEGEATSNFFTDADGTTKTSMIIRDITERKKAEKQLQNTKNQLETIINSVTDGILVLDKNWRYTFVSETAGRIVGIPAKEILGQSVWEKFPHAVNSKFYTEYHRAVETGKPVYFEEYYPEPINRWLELYCYPSKDGLTVFFHDVTERRKAEEALKQSEEQARQRAEELQKLMDIIPAAVWVSNDPECTVIIGNQTANHFYEVQGGENVSAGPASGGQHDTTRRFFLNGRELSPSELPMQEAAAKNKEIKNTELEVLNPSGRKMTIFGSAKPLLDSEGKVRGCLGAFLDITERKIAEETLKQRTEQLEQTKKKIEENACQLEEYSTQMEQLAKERLKQLQDAERMAAIGQTAGMVGHDIRNPLQAITGDVYLLTDYLSTMPDNTPLKKDAEESLEQIDENIGYINKIVADLQDYSRVLKPEYTIVGLYDLVTSVFKPIKLPSNITPSINIDPSLHFKSDQTLLRRILTNLIINAIQAMEKGGILDISGLSNGDSVVITVEDTGEGIPKDFASKLFTPMLSTKSKGQGLGLAVVKRLVEALNGAIRFDSKVNRGTKFIIQLPLTQ